MKVLLILMVLFGASVGEVQSFEPMVQDDDAVHADVRFGVVDVLIDSGDVPLAAYQVEVWAERGDVTIVGIEGGEAEPFRHPPYYDPAAMQEDRVILAAFSTATAEQLPSGVTRLVSIHVRIAGQEKPEFNIRLHVAGDVDGNEIKATASLQTGSET